MCQKLNLRKDSFGNMYCKITDTLDKCTKVKVDEITRNYLYRGFILQNSNQYTIAIRYPGATRGSIFINRETKVIENIKLYNDTKDIYEDRVHETLAQYIGCKIE